MLAAIGPKISLIVATFQFFVALFPDPRLAKALYDITRTFALSRRVASSDDVAATPFKVCEDLRILQTNDNTSCCQSTVKVTAFSQGTPRITCVPGISATINCTLRR